PSLRKRTFRGPRRPARPTADAMDLPVRGEPARLRQDVPTKVASVGLPRRGASEHLRAQQSRSQIMTTLKAPVPGFANGRITFLPLSARYLPVVGASNQRQKSFFSVLVPSWCPSVCEHRTRVTYIFRAIYPSCNTLRNE